MSPINSIVISDDEEPDPQETLSRDLASLDEEIGKTSEAVKELNAEVTSYTNLLKAAQSRLHKAREQKERLIDNKQKLLDKKLKFLQSNPVARSIGVPVGAKVQKETKSEPIKRPPAAADVIEIDQVTKASPKSNNSSRKALSSHPTHPARVSPLQIQKSPSLPLSLDHELSSPTSNHDPEAGMGPELKSPSRAAPKILDLPSARPVAKSIVNPSEGSSYFRSSVTRPDNDSKSPSASKRNRPQRVMKLRGSGSRRSYGGALSGVRLGASICGRIPSEHDSAEEQLRGTKGKKGRAMIYSPYWEASDSESESGNSLGRKSQLLADTTLTTQVSPQNIPVNPKTHSRIEISSVIGGKTQGTWCTINPNKTTVYNAGSYMALDRGLNHLLPENPGENGGVYVADWLKKEVGKTYQIFIKRASNHWLLYGKYLVASIREVSLDEWQSFDDKDKNRWAEHLLEHQWGKKILQKKKLLTEAQCIKPSWMKVLSFFNQHNRPNLRLKVLELRFISYDRGLYDALVSASPVERKAKRKRHSSEYDEDEDDI